MIASYTETITWNSGIEGILKTHLCTLLCVPSNGNRHNLAFINSKILTSHAKILRAKYWAKCTIHMTFCLIPFYKKTLWLKLAVFTDGCFSHRCVTIECGQPYEFHALFSLVLKSKTWSGWSFVKVLLVWANRATKFRGLVQKLDQYDMFCKRTLTSIITKHWCVKIDEWLTGNSANLNML